jgi:hypothetical protein
MGQNRQFNDSSSSSEYQSNFSIGFGIDIWFVVGIIIGWALGKKY